jgi:hypothetical protein
VRLHPEIIFVRHRIDRGLYLGCRQIPDGLRFGSRLASSAIAIMICVPCLRAKSFNTAGAYVKSLWGASAAFLCVSLCVFSLQEIGAGCAAFAVFCRHVVYSVKARKNYMENCSQALAQDQRENRDARSPMRE